MTSCWRWRLAEDGGFGAFFRSDHYLNMGDATAAPARPTPGRHWPAWPGKPAGSGSAPW